MRHLPARRFDAQFLRQSDRYTASCRFAGPSVVSLTTAEIGGTALEPTRAPVPTEFPRSSPSPLSRSGTTRSLRARDNARGDAAGRGGHVFGLEPVPDEPGDGRSAADHEHSDGAGLQQPLLRHVDFGMPGGHRTIQVVGQQRPSPFHLARPEGLHKRLWIRAGRATVFVPPPVGVGGPNRERLGQQHPPRPGHLGGLHDVASSPDQDRPDLDQGGNIRADPGGYLPEAVRPAIYPPQSGQGPEGGGGVGAAPAKARGYGDLFRQEQLSARLPALGLGQGVGGPDHQVVLPPGNVGGALAHHGQQQPLSSASLDPVGQGDRQDQRSDVVIAILPPAQHVQKEVELRRGRFRDGPGLTHPAPRSAWRTRRGRASRPGPEDRSPPTTAPLWPEPGPTPGGPARWSWSSAAPGTPPRSGRTAGWARPPPVQAGGPGAAGPTRSSAPARTPSVGSAAAPGPRRGRPPSG